jgi:hypothetical protein
MNTQRVTVRDLRKNIKQFLDGSEAVAIGDYYALRGFVVPVPKHSNYNESDRAKAIRLAKAAFAKVIARELPKSGSLLRG